MTCCHCNREMVIHARGLCNTCYHSPARHQYRRGDSRHEFTAAEIALVKTLRAARVRKVDIAKRLGRSFGSINSLCGRLEIRIRRKRPRELSELVWRMFRPKRSDAWLAAQLGCHPDTVRRYRIKLGLRRAVNPPGYRSRSKREPTEAELNAMIAEQMKCLPEYWESDSEKQRKKGAA